MDKTCGLLCIYIDNINTKFLLILHYIYCHKITILVIFKVLKRGGGRMLKKLRVVKWLVVVSIIFLFIIEANVILFSLKAKAVKSDCVIILGCSVYGTSLSPFLQWRTQEGLRLYKEGMADKIIVSGAQGPGEDISEAEAMKRYLLAKGVPTNHILMEDKSRSTMANLINSKAIMKEQGYKSAVIVSNKYHLKRASLMAEEQGINASYSGVFVTPYKSHEIAGYIREMPAIVKYYIIKLST